VPVEWENYIEKNKTHFEETAGSNIGAKAG
jgi:hypothetical protein